MVRATATPAALEVVRSDDLSYTTNAPGEGA
jgi:hypothetical protein